MYHVSDIDSWMVGSEIAAGSYIPVDALIIPGSDEYISMSVKPGNIIYGFSITQSDSYLFTNAHAGEGLDIYLSYNLRTVTNESGGVSATPTVNTSNDINDRHFKLLLKNKKILSIQSSNATSKVVQQNPLKNEGYVLVELTPAEVRTLKGLDDAKLYIFPTTEGLAKPDFSHSVLVGDEGQWPIDNRNILSTVIKTGVENESVIEYRGSSKAETVIKKDEG